MTIPNRTDGHPPVAEKMTLLSRRTFLTTIATGALAQLTWQPRLAPLTPYPQATGSGQEAADLEAGLAPAHAPYSYLENTETEASGVRYPRYSGLLQDFPKATNYVEYVETYARETGLDPLLVMAVIRQESLFGHFVVFDLGAVGVM